MTRRSKKRGPRPDNPLLTANRLVLGAIEFADLADVYVSSRPPLARNSLVAAFVLALALELALKSVLRKDGASEAELKRISHDVERAYDCVLRAHPDLPRLRINPARVRVLALLGLYYKDKTLEYTSVGWYEAPKLYVLRGMVREAIGFALDHVYGAGAQHARRNSRGVRIGAPKAAYGNMSRRGSFKAQLAEFERLSKALG